MNELKGNNKSKLSDNIDISNGKLISINREIEPIENEPIIWTTSTIREYIKEVALEYNVDPSLALDLVIFESNLDPKAENPKSTAKGLFQHLDGTWEYYCKGDVFNPKDSIDCGILMLSKPNGLNNWHIDQNVCDYLATRGHIDSVIECAVF